MPELRETVLVDYLRTPMSRSRPDKPERAAFHEIPADNLLAMVVKEIIKRAKFDPNDIDEMITGCARLVGENFTWGGRQPLWLSLLPDTIAAMGVDRQCASSATAVNIAAMKIMTGSSEIVLACGMENMTRIYRQKDLAVKHTELTDANRFPDHRKYNLDIGFSMLQTAQKLWEENPDITREDMDRYSLNSHERAAKARNDGFFDKEILPIEGKTSDGTTKIIKYDLSIREGSTMEKMAKLRIVSEGITKDPQITPGNASPLNAGAVCTVLMSRERAEELGIKPMAKIRGFGSAGVNPSVMGKGPVPASRKALNHAGLKVEDIDYWEINEAFAIVPLYVMKVLGVPEEKVNVKGGAIALGHPLGVTGARLIGTLARILDLEGGKLGLATACVGGGQGVATVIEKL
ncbi:MAG: acetyl-CoA C-acyltransferase [Promethearchaeota archaeon]